MVAINFFRYLLDVELRPSDTVSITKTVEKDELLLSLMIDKLQLDDAGQIKVKASNLLGDVTSTAMLTVKGTI